MYRSALHRLRPALPAELEGAAAALMGSYRHAVGWGRGRAPTASMAASYELHVLRGQTPAPEDETAGGLRRPNINN